MTEQKTDRVTITETSGEDSLLKFPTEFPIKVMGLTTPDFAEVIGSAVREIAPDFDPAGIKTEYSKTRKYTSLTVVVNAQISSTPFTVCSPRTRWSRLFSDTK